MRALTMSSMAVVLLLGVAGEGTAQERPDRENSRADRFVDLLDTDGDGTVSKAEIAAEYGRLFGAADVDGDGSLSPDEFRRRGRLFQSLGATTLFDMLDGNSDQVLTIEEITVPSDRWVTRYDQNGDDGLDREEFPTRTRRSR